MPGPRLGTADTAPGSGRREGCAYWGERSAGAGEAGASGGGGAGTGRCEAGATVAQSPGLGASELRQALRSPSGRPANSPGLHALSWAGGRGPAVGSTGSAAQQHEPRWKWSLVPIPPQLYSTMFIVHLFRSLRSA